MNHNDVVLRTYHNDVIIFIIFATYKYHLIGYSLKTWERQKKNNFSSHTKTESYKCVKIVSYHLSTQLKIPTCKTKILYKLVCHISGRTTHDMLTENISITDMPQDILYNSFVICNLQTALLK